MRSWEEREKRLEAARLKERALEERVRKRRRLDGGLTHHRPSDDDDAQWLLDDPGDRATGPQDALSGLSKESREILSKIGLGGRKRQDTDEEEPWLEEGIKVRS